MDFHTFVSDGLKILDNKKVCLSEIVQWSFLELIAGRLNYFESTGTKYI